MRGYCVAKNATRRAARPGPSLRNCGLLRMTKTINWCYRVG